MKKKVIIIFTVVALIGGTIYGFTYKSTNSCNGKVNSGEEIERSQPRNFLTADEICAGFEGDTIKVHGVIKNKATVASYKDAVVRLTYYSYTKTELGHKEYTINKVFPPHSEVKVEFKIEDKIENYKEVNTIGWDLIQATSN
jgi:hypothetical protein